MKGRIAEVGEKDLQKKLLHLVYGFPNALKEHSDYIIAPENIDRAFDEVFNNQPRPAAILAVNSLPQNMTTEIYPIKIDSHTQDSFNLWVRKLHTELTARRNFIDACTLDDFKNIFTLNNEKSRQGKKLNWCKGKVFLLHLCRD